MVYLKEYLFVLARVTSGEYLHRTWKVLRSLLCRVIPAEQLELLGSCIPRLRRDANVRTPVRHRPADAITLDDLDMILECAKYTKLSEAESIALEISTIAFSTMSRVAEITALEVRDVKEDGMEISLRPKTYANTWRRLVKRVSDWRNIRAATALRRRREAAIRAKRTLLFPTRNSPTTQLSSSAVSASLKSALKKLGVSRRVTSHSGRKGAALESLLTGIPVVAIQAFGGWRNVASLERYVGEALRRNIALGDLWRHKTIGDIGRQQG